MALTAEQYQALINDRQSPNDATQVMSVRTADDLRVPIEGGKICAVHLRMYGAQVEANSELEKLILDALTLIKKNLLNRDGNSSTRRHELQNPVTTVAIGT